VKIYDFVHERKPEILVKLRKEQDYDDEMAAVFDEVIKEYIDEVKATRPDEDLDLDEEESNVGVDVLDKATTKKKDEEGEKKEEKAEAK